MEKVETKFSQPSVRDDLVVLGSFLIFGGISGLLFAGLTTRGSLQDFFYFKGDKFLIPRYSYWIAFSLMQLIGLASPYLLSYSRGWLVRRVPSARLLFVAVMIGAAAPLLRLLARPMNTVFGPAWDFGVAPLTLLILLSCALCITTADARRLPLAIFWIILFVAGGLAVISMLAQFIERVDLVQWSILHSMIGLGVGNWLIWRQRKWLEQAREAVK